MFLQQCLYTIQGVTKVFIQEESLYNEHTTLKTGTSHLSDNMHWGNCFQRKGIGVSWCVRYLLFAHPVVNLLSVPVEELQVHALFILLPANLPQL